ncbi:prepilin-type N-terminal cleavage/methylation domain-containing protein [Vibrio sp. V27_P1S3P104]|uniref:GspH/FimT family pseudopilin n=1 Tax=unclassified Vibrio TaxID=2614977 RepID=UPI001373198F|nr:MULTISPECIES: GspH/FimT family pseudopilin [unclassified Vibrio]NAW68412.1 prepilin-type N-terminal cleavage/methylation domain-containing protein [Vibrio sp. V28_P6S34P95]NAX05518.1 prepilin-type N-terminal cleavage/methylation domain-containing protein [Vibrio sp. V30_P3S12P165]NAX33586.1 prepilin-type N-terminal cleavage/methylation domain-containing protein [Vibrio sp. V29_P1S30P107]NAX38223.1 prepilin-type N-terminal cleavage/methylation domain-containing protein [Vibrio sp. V27_P1S3P10
MVRGFTLLELLITVSVLAVMLTFSAPNFTNINQQTKMVTLADELHGFFIQAKSEAVFRGQDLWVHIEGMPSTTGEWRLILSSSSVLPPANSPKIIAVLSGERYRNLFIDNTDSINSVKFDYVMGNPVQAGSLTLKKHFQDSDGIKVIIHNRAGRIKVCSLSGENYGFTKC